MSSSRDLRKNEHSVVRPACGLRKKRPEPQYVHARREGGVDEAEVERDSKHTQSAHTHTRTHTRTHTHTQSTHKHCTALCLRLLTTLNPDAMSRLAVKSATTNSERDVRRVSATDCATLSLFLSKNPVQLYLTCHWNVQVCVRVCVCVCVLELNLL